MRRVISIIIVALVVSGTWLDPAGAQGRLKGGEAYALPSWFKSSFLDFPADVADARKNGRHVLVFLHLDDCPYCARMLKENFAGGENREFLQKHFDVIAVNIRGALDVAWIDGKAYTERTLSRHLKVVATPTIVFLAPEAGQVLQLTGYRDPRGLRQALEYVQGGHYRTQRFPAFVAARDKAAVYVLRQHPQFSPATNFKGYRKPLAVLFEDGQCTACARFHERTLSHPDVIAEMKKLLFVRLDAGSDRPVVDLDGKMTTAVQWVKALDLSNRPALVLFDEGREVFRVDGQLYHFHFKEALRYVSGGHYRQYPTISAYNAARRAELLKQGVDIDYSE